jgi:hypothetical protein
VAFPRPLSVRTLDVTPASTIGRDVGKINYIVEVLWRMFRPSWLHINSYPLYLAKYIHSTNNSSFLAL